MKIIWRTFVSLISFFRTRHLAPTPVYILGTLTLYVRMHDFINYTFKSSYGEPQICANTLLSYTLQWNWRLIRRRDFGMWTVLEKNNQKRMAVKQRVWRQSWMGGGRWGRTGRLVKSSLKEWSQITKYVCWINLICIKTQLIFTSNPVRCSFQLFTLIQSDCYANGSAPSILDCYFCWKESWLSFTNKIETDLGLFIYRTMARCLSWHLQWRRRCAMLNNGSTKENKR